MRHWHTRNRAKRKAIRVRQASPLFQHYHTNTPHKSLTALSSEFEMHVYWFSFSFLDTHFNDEPHDDETPHDAILSCTSLLHSAFRKTLQIYIFQNVHSNQACTLSMTNIINTRMHYARARDCIRRRRRWRVPCTCFALSLRIHATIRQIAVDTNHACRQRIKNGRHRTLCWTI